MANPTPPNDVPSDPDLLPSDDSVNEKHMKMVNYMKLLADQLRAYGSKAQVPRLWATIYKYTKDKDAENNKLNAEPLSDNEWQAAAVQWGRRNRGIENTLCEIDRLIRNDTNPESSLVHEIPNRISPACSETQISSASVGCAMQ